MLLLRLVLDLYVYDAPLVNDSMITFYKSCWQFGDLGGLVCITAYFVPKE